MDIYFKKKYGYILIIAEIGLGSKNIFFVCKVFYVRHGSVIIGAESIIYINKANYHLQKTNSSNI